MDRIQGALKEKKQLTMLYFWFTDIVGHVTRDKPSLNNMYKMVANIFTIIKHLGGDESLYMVMSDHGMTRGHHNPEGAFWSLSKPLLEQDIIISVENWYKLIEKWMYEINE